jgi:hypothetical protein
LGLAHLVWPSALLQAQSAFDPSIQILFVETDEQAEGLALNIEFSIVDSAGDPLRQAYVEAVEIQLIGKNTTPIAAAVDALPPVDGLNRYWVARAKLQASQSENQAVLRVKLGEPAIYLSETFQFHSNVDYAHPPADVRIGSIRYEESRNIYVLALEVTSPELIDRIIVQAWDTRGGTQVGSGDHIFENAELTMTVEVEAAGFAAGREYTFRVIATDHEGLLLNKPNEDPLSTKKQTLLDEKTVQYAPPQPKPPEVTIESVNADYEQARLLINLKYPADAPLQTFAVLVIDNDTGQETARYEPELFKGTPIAVSLPAAMWQLNEDGYQLIVNLALKDGSPLAVIAPRAFKPRPPDPPPWWERAWEITSNNRSVQVSILVILFCALGSFVLPGLLRTRRGILAPLPVHRTEEVRIAGVRVASEVRLRVKVIQTPNTSQRVDKLVTKFPCIIGREPGCDIHLANDKRLSRRHVEITLDRDKFFVEPQG